MTLSVWFKLMMELLIYMQVGTTIYFLNIYSEMRHNEATSWCVRQHRLQCKAGGTQDREIQESYE